jgi:hypothetical protein
MAASWFMLFNSKVFRAFFDGYCELRGFKAKNLQNRGSSYL